MRRVFERVGLGGDIGGRTWCGWDGEVGLCPLHKTWGLVRTDLGAHTGRFAPDLNRATSLASKFQQASTGWYLSLSDVFLLFVLLP